MSVITEEWLRDVEARLARLDEDGERSLSLRDLVSQREEEAGAEAAAKAAAAARNGERRALYVAQRAMKQFTGGHYLCPGPVAGVKCSSRHGRRHYSPDYKGKDWKCCDCRCLRDKFILAKHSNLSAKSDPWYPRSA